MINLKPMEPFKNVYNKKSIALIAELIKKSDNSFEVEKFCKEIEKELNPLELKDRVRLISSKLYQYLPQEYKQAISILLQTLAPPSQTSSIKDADKKGLSGFMVWPLTQFVEDHGLEHFDLSMKALEEMTQRFTAEFAVRAFINHNPQKAYKYFQRWSKSKSFHLRRLSSEGIRPTLPWGNKIERLDEFLDKNIDILKRLSQDPEVYVQKSVANHLNDISRIDSKLFFQTLSSFDLKNKNTAWIARHASRTLLKQGNKKALKLHGYKTNIKVLTDFKIRKTMTLDKAFPLKLSIQNTESKKQKLLVEYVIGLRKKNGIHNEKAFRLKDFTLDANESITINKNIGLKKVTTRSYYSGLHYLFIQINGKRFESSDFNLIIPK